MAGTRIICPSIACVFDLRKSLGPGKAAPEHWVHYRAMALRGFTLASVKKYQQAEPLLIRAYEELQARTAELPPSRKEIVAEALDWLLAMYDNWGQLDKANAWRKKTGRTKK